MRAAKFWIGVILFVGNFIVGKMATLLFIINYNKEVWRSFSIALYAFSWIMLFVGGYLVGKEGWQYMVKVSKEYQTRTVETIKGQSQKTYYKVREGVKRSITPKKDNIR